MGHWKDILLGGFLFFCLYQLFGSGDIERKPGLWAPEAPLQVEVSGVKPWKFKGFVITPRASWDATGRVLHTNRYYIGTEAKLSPLDIGIGWGRMSDGAILNKIRFGHRRRYLTWRSDEWPLEFQEVNSSASNMHCIPATKSLERRLKRVEIDDLVRITGYLVNVARPDGWHWNTSLSRTDQAGGACELVWVENVVVLRSGGS